MTLTPEMPNQEHTDNAGMTLNREQGQQVQDMATTTVGIMETEPKPNGYEVSKDSTWANVDVQKVIEQIKPVIDHLGRDGYVRLAHGNANIKGDFHPKAVSLKEFEDEASKLLSTPEFNASRDLYWAPCAFKGKTGEVDDANVPVVNHFTVEIDGGSSITDWNNAGLMPSYYQESSPGHYHCIWLISSKVPLNVAKLASGYLGPAIKCGKGGSDIGQVIRLPLTYNHKKEHVEKHGKAPHVSGLKGDGRIYEFPVFLGACMVQAEKNGYRLNSDNRACNDPIQLLSKDEYLELAKKYSAAVEKVYKGDIAMRVLHEAPEMDPSTGKLEERSDKIFNADQALKWAKVPRDDRAKLLKRSEWNPYKGRKDEDKQIWAIVDKNDNGDTRKKASLGSAHRASPRYLTMDQLMMMTGSPHCIIEGWLTEHGQWLIAGIPKAGKSLLAVDAAVSIASGKPFLGMYQVDRPRKVLYIDGENGNSLMWERIAKVMLHRGITGSLKTFDDGRIEIEPPELPNLFLVPRGRRFMLDTPEGLDELKSLLEEIKPEVIIVDPFYKFFTGEYNSPQHVGKILSDLTEVCDAFGVTPGVVHHYKKDNANSPKSGGQRILGSQLFHGWATDMWFVEKPKLKQGEEREEDEENEDNPRDDDKKPLRMKVTFEFRDSECMMEMPLRLEFTMKGRLDDIDNEIIYEVKKLSKKQAKNPWALTDKEKAAAMYIKKALEENGGFKNKNRLKNRVMDMVKVDAVIEIADATVERAIDKLMKSGAVEQNGSGILAWPGGETIGA